MLFGQEKTKLALWSEFNNKHKSKNKIKNKIVSQHIFFFKVLYLAFHKLVVMDADSAFVTVKFQSLMLPIGQVNQLHTSIITLQCLLYFCQGYILHLVFGFGHDPWHYKLGIYQIIEAKVLYISKINRKCVDIHV